MQFNIDYSIMEPVPIALGKVHVAREIHSKSKKVQISSRTTLIALFFERTLLNKTVFSYKGMNRMAQADLTFGDFAFFFLQQNLELFAQFCLWIMNELAIYNIIIF